MSNNTASSLPAFKQSHRKHMLIGACLLSIIAGLVCTLIYSMQRLDTAANELTSLVQERDSEVAQVAYLTSQKEALRATEEERARLATYFMTEKSVAGFLNRVEALGRGMGLAITTVSLGVSNGVLQTNIRAEGSFTAVSQLVSVIEKMPYKLNIDHADIVRTGSGAWSVNIAAGVISFTPAQ